MNSLAPGRSVRGDYRRDSRARCQAPPRVIGEVCVASTRPVPGALPEGAPLDNVGTGRAAPPGGGAPNIVKDGTPQEALSSGCRSLRLSDTRGALSQRRFRSVPGVRMLRFSANGAPRSLPGVWCRHRLVDRADRIRKMRTPGTDHRPRDFQANSGPWSSCTLSWGPDRKGLTAWTEAYR